MPSSASIAVAVAASLAAASGSCSQRAPAPPPAPPPPPAPAATGPETPCFPGKPLLATALYRALERYAQSVYASADEPPPPPTTYGTCTVARNEVRDARGRLVAELGCGVRILQRGIRDDLGLEIGAFGRDVLARAPRPLTALSCFPNGPDQARCQFARPADAEMDLDTYVVRGALPTTLTGDAALAFFTDREIVELDVSVWCH